MGADVNLDKVRQYRLRRLALNLQQFTVKELEAAAGVTPQVAQAFIQQELNGAKSALVARKPIETHGRVGRPQIRYTLTNEGIEVLASKNLTLARELNDALDQVRTGPTIGAEPASAPLGIGPVRAVSDTTENSLDGSVVVKGEISGSGAGSLVINGTIEGVVELPNFRISVGSSGAIMADVTARELVIRGRVHGNVTAELLQITSNGSLVGDVVCQRISIEDGAHFKGAIDIRRSGQRGFRSAPPDSNVEPATESSVSLERAHG